jgi:hypothetical protein
MEELRKTIDMDKNFGEAHLFLGWVYEQKSRFSEEIGELRQAVSILGVEPRVLGALGHAYAISGDRKSADEALAQMKEQSKHRYVSPYDIAAVYSGLKDTEQTFTHLDMAYKDHSSWMCWLGVDPRFDGIRTDPRYQDILRRMHLIP